MNIISAKEYIGTLIVMCVIWVMMPWEPDLSRLDVAIAFICVACIAFAVVAITETVMDEINRFWEGRRKG